MNFKAGARVVVLNVIGNGIPHDLEGTLIREMNRGMWNGHWQVQLDYDGAVMHFKPERFISPEEHTKRLKEKYDATS